MRDSTILFFLVCIIIVLLLIIVYQQFAFTKGVQKKLNALSQSLYDILNHDSDEKVMVFTDNKVLMHLCGQINRLLLDRQKIRTDYRKHEMASKKMLSNISHDIKTPLTVILGYLEIIRLNNPEDEALQRVEAKAKQVMELINQFFTLAKLEAGDMNLKIGKVNISALCKENILDFYDILSRQKFEVDISIPEQDIYVLGDADAIQRILFNLLSNAIRYGSDGNYIGLFLREETNYVLIEIIDRGKGIEKEFAAHVFERLYTMEDSRNRKIQGNGLGLTIAKNLVNQLGGELALNSEPGIRTVFTVKLKKFLYDN